MKNFKKFLVFSLLILTVGCSATKNTEKEVKVEEKKEDKAFKDFNFVFKKVENSKKELILPKGIKNDFQVYTLGVKVDMEISGKKTPLKEVLKEYSIEDIMKKVNSDISKKLVKAEDYKDGGTTVIRYGDFVIVKFDKLDGYKDMYFTEKFDSLSEFEKSVRDEKSEKSDR